MTMPDTSAGVPPAPSSGPQQYASPEAQAPPAAAASTVDPVLAQILERLTASSLAPPHSSSGVRYEKPERFKGDASKFQAFLTAVQVCVDLDPKLLHEPTRILWVGTLLGGPPALWFSGLRQAIDPSCNSALSPEDRANAQDILTSWTAFLAAFSQFAEYGAADSALDKLDALRQTGTVVEYHAHFVALVTLAPINAFSIVRYFYKGLSDPIKDAIAASSGGRPDNLNDLVALAKRIDGERQRRRRDQRQSGNSGSSGGQRDNSSGGKDSGRSTSSGSGGQGGGSQGSGKKPSPSPKTKAPTPESRPPPSGTELDPSTGRYKLTAAERERRLKNDLCMRCGKSGHIAKDCSGADSSSAKGQPRA